jgi:hypothetical protein
VSLVDRLASPAAGELFRSATEGDVAMDPERRWRIVVSITASSVACVIGLWSWWQAAPDLWKLATLTFTGPIRPMGLTGYLWLGVFGFFLGWLLIGLVGALSRRPAAGWAAAAGGIAVLLPLLNFVLFFVIIFVRDIEPSP